jgi:predicted Zn-dependent peptidase
MVDYSKKVLDNGLSVVVHKDTSTPLVAVNILYKVGSKDEDPNKTGFAHLFEHLMFSGTDNIDSYDDVIQNAGGENNAFTNSDITNFYSIVPAENLETVLWLEADRMKGPKFNNKSIEIQKKVVIEEFKETCLNEPYGDTWHHLSELAYINHPYRWPTIGRDISHIENATIEDVESFFSNFYKPNNAIIVVAGNIEDKIAFDLVEKWFGHIPSSSIKRRPQPWDDTNRNLGQRTVKSNVPLDSITIAFSMCDRCDESYYAVDLLSDILGSGRSSRLYKELVVNKEILSSVDAFISGTKDPGLFLVEGRPSKGISINEAREAIWEVIDNIKKSGIDTRELQKIKNKAESNLVFSETSVLNKAISLAYFDYLDDIDLINREVNCYHEITAPQLQQIAQQMFVRDKSLELVYNPI